MSKNNSPEFIVILVPGLGDNIYQLQIIKRLWAANGITVHIHTAPWKTTEEHLEAKLQRLLKYIDQLAKPTTKITLIGASAGGSLVINAYLKRKSKIHRVINVCGRVKKGTHIFPSLELAAKDFPAFYQSVIACEKELKNFTSNDKRKIMTIKCFLFDAVVPMSCVEIKGATNTTVPMFFHMFGIAIALTLWRKKLIDFILT